MLFSSPARSRPYVNSGRLRERLQYGNALRGQPRDPSVSLYERSLNAVRCPFLTLCTLPARIWVAFAATLFLVCFCAPAEGQIRESFESPQPSWRLSEADCGVRVLAQQRTFRDAHSGNGCEFLRLAVGNGTFVHVSHSLGKAPVIAELAPSMWVKADKPHIQLMLRVVLPRNVDQASGKPLTTLLRGDMYTDVGNWQQLRVPDPATLFARETIALRTQFGTEVDAREAYIDLVVLNVYSSPGNLDLWIDDLEIQGFIPTVDAAGNPLVQKPVERTDADERMETPLDDRTGSVLMGSILTANGRPFMPRMIQHHGEPLEWLASLGFNAVKLNASPTPADLREAERLDLWLFSPPPYLESGEQLGPQYDRVLAWSLGAHLTDRDLTSTRLLSDEIRQIDPRRQRPTVCGADSDFDAYSRQTGVMLFDQPLAGTSFELAGYRQWLQTRSRLGRPGTPFWAAVWTQPSPKLSEQLILFSQGSPPNEDIDPEQLRLNAYTALAAGARGLLFASHTALSIDTPTSVQRTDTLKLLNFELRALEPWIAGGSIVEDMSTADPHVHVSIWQTERSRLLLLTQQAPAQQYVIGPPPRSQVAVVVPGVQVSERAYQITPGGLKQLRGVHGSGGMRVTIDSPGLAAAIVITQDPLVLHHLNKTLSERQRQVAQIRHDVAARRLNQTIDIEKKLQLRSEPVAQSAQWLKEAQVNLEQARRLFEANDYDSVHDFSAKAEESLAKVRRGYWEQTAAAFPSPASSPCVSSFTALPLHWTFAERMSRMRWGPNVLAGGDMESLEQLTTTGWRNQRRLPPGVQSDVSLSLQTPHSGRTALRVSAWSADGTNAPTFVDRAPVWITSNAVRVRQGQVARVHGWVFVPRPVLGSQEGLLVFDSVGGPELGERISATQGWREFSLYRAVPQNGDFTVTFALTGLGEAWIDDVAVQLLDPEPIRPVTQNSPPARVDEARYPLPVLR